MLAVGEYYVAGPALKMLVKRRRERGGRGAEIPIPTYAPSVDPCVTFKEDLQDLRYHHEP